MHVHYIMKLNYTARSVHIVFHRSTMKYFVPRGQTTLYVMLFRRKIESLVVIFHVHFLFVPSSPRRILFHSARERSASFPHRSIRRYISCAYLYIFIRARVRSLFLSGFLSIIKQLITMVAHICIRLSCSSRLRSPCKIICTHWWCTELRNIILSYGVFAEIWIRIEWEHFAAFKAQRFPSK